MPALLVSVRSAEEAIAAWHAGARVIDIKEPSRGPLGRADDSVWKAVRNALPAEATVSVALGELSECEPLPPPCPAVWTGITWRKVGLAGMAKARDWPRRLRAFQDRWGHEPGWIAVAYLDEPALAPPPLAVLTFVMQSHCRGVLFDTWSKRLPSCLSCSDSWREIVQRTRAANLLVALAGGLDLQAIQRLRPLEPDFFAVRGAACVDGDRNAPIDARRVEALARAAE